MRFDLGFKKQFTAVCIHTQPNFMYVDAYIGFRFRFYLLKVAASIPALTSVPVIQRATPWRCVQTHAC